MVFGKRTGIDKQEAINRFREELKGCDPVYQDIVFSFQELEKEDDALDRYLKGESYNVEKALKKLSKFIDLWKELSSHSFYADNPDEVIGAPLSVALSQFPYFFHSNDKQGSVVCYFLAGKTNLDGVDCVMDKKKLLPMLLHLMMIDAKKLFLNGKQKSSESKRLDLFSIIDMQGCSMSMCKASYVATLARVISGLGDIQPEMMDRWVIINTPTFFSGVWTIFKTFIPSHIVENIVVISDKDKADKYLQQHIAKEDLVSDFGGDSISLAETIMKKGSNGREKVHRQIVEHFTVSRGKPYKFNFELNENEKLPSMTIHSNHSSLTEKSFQLMLLNEKNETLKEETFDDSVNSNNVFDCDCIGPGNFSFTCQPSTWSISSNHFVIAADIYNNN